MRHKKTTTPKGGTAFTVSLGLAFLSFGLSIPQAQTWVEKDGIVIIEAEGVSPQGNWQLKTDISRFTGTGYLEAQSIGEMSYPIKIAKPGTYRFYARSAASHWESGNDSYFRLTGNGVSAVGRDLGYEGDEVTPEPADKNACSDGGWHKVYNNRAADIWSWHSRNCDWTNQVLHFKIPGAGTYTLGLKYRSRSHKVDRMVLVHTDRKPEEAWDLALPQTLETGPSAKPAISTQPHAISRAEGSLAAFSVRATNNPSAYQWKRNGQNIPGATLRYYDLPSVTLADNNAEFSVVVTNAQGSTTSSTAKLSVTSFTGFTIRRASGAVTVDGEANEAAWQSAPAQSLDKSVLGKPSSATDLSATFKTLWGDAGLYVLIDVKDNSIATPFTGGDVYKNDGVEVFLDSDNSRSGDYGPHDFQLRIMPNNTMQEDKHGSTDGVVMAQKLGGGGYVIELLLPWSWMGANLKDGEFVGIDVQVSDNDGADRKTKISWHSDTDDSYADTGLFLVARLVGTDGTVSIGRSGPMPSGSAMQVPKSLTHGRIFDLLGRDKPTKIGRAK